MTAPAEHPPTGAQHSGGIAQIVRWLAEPQSVTGSDDAGFYAGVARRPARWAYGDPPAKPVESDAEIDPLREVRIGPAPRCAIAGETIALSVSLINSRGTVYLGWPIKLHWSSSDASVATVNEYGIVEVKARGRVELTCTCEGITGSVQLTVVEPAVAVAVGLPVPDRLVPLTRRSGAVKRVAEAPPAHRRSIERGSIKHGPVAAFLLARGTRRFAFRAVVATATAGVVAMVMSRSPEDYFVVSEPPGAAAAERIVRSAAMTGRPSTRSADSRRGAAPSSSVVPSTSQPALVLPASANPALVVDSGRVVTEAAGSAVLPPTTTDGSADQPAPTPVGSADVARLVVTASQSQLVEGESVRLSAVGIDERGEPVSVVGVSWKSENEDIAGVDPNGLVTGRRPGTVTVGVTFGDRTGRVTLTVGPRPAAEPQPPPNARASNDAAPANRPAALAAQVIRGRVDEFMQALRERDGSRVAALFNAESAQDRKNLQALLERLRRPEARLKASDPQLGAPEIREMEAAVEFHVPMSWTTPFGRVRSQTSTFRAVFEPSDAGWRLVGIRATGKID